MLAGFKVTKALDKTLTLNRDMTTADFQDAVNREVQQQGLVSDEAASANSRRLPQRRGDDPSSRCVPQRLGRGGLVRCRSSYSYEIWKRLRTRELFDSTAGDPQPPKTTVAKLQTAYWRHSGATSM